jgi:hypothetical protein
MLLTQFLGGGQSMVLTLQDQPMLPNSKARTVLQIHCYLEGASRGKAPYFCLAADSKQIIDS